MRGSSWRTASTSARSGCPTCRSPRRCPSCTRSTPRRSAQSSPTVPRSRGCCPDRPARRAAPDDQSNRLQLFDGLVEVLGAVGSPGHPLLLVLEDLHWADASSRDVLRFLVSRLRDQHLLVVASYRTDDLHRRHPWRPVATELSRHPRVERLDLSPFTDDELREFTTAAERLPADRVHAAPGHRPVRGQRVLRGGAPGGRRRGGRAAVVARRRPARAARAARPVGPAPGPHRVRGGAPGLGAAAARRGRRGRGPAADRPRRASTRRCGRPSRTTSWSARTSSSRSGTPCWPRPCTRTCCPGSSRRCTARTCGCSATTRRSARRRSWPRTPCAPRTCRRRCGRRSTRPHQAHEVLAPAEELRHLEVVLRLWEAVPEVDGDARASTTSTSSSRPPRPRAAPGRSTARSSWRGPPSRRPRPTCPARPACGPASRGTCSAWSACTTRWSSRRARSPTSPTRPTPARAWALATYARSALNADLDDEAWRARPEAVELARQARRGRRRVRRADHAGGARGGRREPRGRAAAQRAGPRPGGLRLRHRAAHHVQPGQQPVLRGRPPGRDAGDRRRRRAGPVAGHVVERLRRRAAHVHAPHPVRLGRPDAGPTLGAVPDELADTLVAVDLYAAAARGDADAAERGHALEPSWDARRAHRAGRGRLHRRRPHLARRARRGDRARPAAARAPVARVVRLLPGRHLAGRAGDARAGRRGRAGAPARQGRVGAGGAGRPAARARE